MFLHVAHSTFASLFHAILNANPILPPAEEKTCKKVSQDTKAAVEFKRICFRRKLDKYKERLSFLLQSHMELE